jgi:hypothetical protein
MSTRSVLVLGSTGSVGTQALDVLAAHPDRFTVAGLAAGGRDTDLLVRQVQRHRVPRLAVASPDTAAELRERLPGVEVLAGPDAATELTATAGADTVLNGITGSVGLGPTLAALGSGATLALANKESLVAGGPLVTGAAATPSTPRWRNASAGVGPRRWSGWCSRRPAARSGGAAGPSSRTSRWPTRSRTRRGTWAPSSRSTRPP